MKTVRCAIYTRKSSEEGLEQDFNSLDAQREACLAYILSQASEGWTLVPGRYDDGGLSGGSLERPALQRLLSDIEAGAIDTVVVYKVDRLTRSLLDFAKLVETFDRVGVSFVSVTQSFNTTTSMGRLTLNMLLSFAQFEREVTAERIRDKIAASKAKGMWMGGTPPLGYAPDGRSLAIVEDHAAIVRRIFELYLDHGNVREVERELAGAGIVSPVRRRSKDGRAFGGKALSRGQLYAILRNPVYAGRIAHQEKSYKGLHPAIIATEDWDRVQTRMSDNRQGNRGKPGVAHASLLAGKIEDGDGNPLIATHACKGSRRYRYYVSKPLHRADTATGLRVPARDLERAAGGLIAQALRQPVQLLDTSLEVDAADLQGFCRRSKELADTIEPGTSAEMTPLVSLVRVHPTSINVELDPAALAAALKVTAREGGRPPGLRMEIRLARSGRAVRLIQGGKSIDASADRSLLRLIALANSWWSELQEGDMDITRLAAREGVTPSYMTRVVRFAFLAPDIVEAVLNDGRRAGDHASKLLVRSRTIPANWDEQRTVLFAGHG